MWSKKKLSEETTRDRLHWRLYFMPFLKHRQPCKVCPEFNLLMFIFGNKSFISIYLFWPSVVASKACRSVLTSCLRCTHHLFLQSHCTTLDCKYLEGTLSLTSAKISGSRLPKMWTKLVWCWLQGPKCSSFTKLIYFLAVMSLCVNKVLFSYFFFAYLIYAKWVNTILIFAICAKLKT